MVPLDSNLITVLPELIVGLTAVLVILLDLFIERGYRGYLAYVGIVGLVIAGASNMAIWQSNNQALHAFNESITMDGFALFANTIFLVVGALVLLLSPDYLKRENLNHSEYYVLVLSAVCGMMLMAASSSLIMIFLSLELFSVCLYVLAGFDRSRERSQEAALKYFLLSAFASALLLYGMALVYGETGSTILANIYAFLRSNPTLNDPVLIIGIGLIVVGLAFKMAAVPFHMWTPDVYEGSPGPVAAFMSVGTKLAAFAAFVRLFGAALPTLYTHWEGIVWCLAVVTMVYGNIAAVVQTNVKRMLGYSSIAQAGYVLVAVASLVTSKSLGTASTLQGPFEVTAVQSTLFYFAVYTFMNIGAFAVLLAVSQKGEVHGNLSDFAGLAKRNPWLAAAMAIFMFSLAGFPPTAGFIGKFFLFQAAVSAHHPELAVIGVLCSLVSVFYYLRIVYYMYMREAPSVEVRPFLPFPWAVTIIASGGGSLIFGVLAGPLGQLTQGQILRFF